MSLSDKILLRKRVLIETINNQLKNQCQIEPYPASINTGFLWNILGALAAYSFFLKTLLKPPTRIR